SGAAQLRLAQAYLLGRGVEKNPKVGLRWLQKAAAGGQPEAQQLLANLARAAELAKVSPEERLAAPRAPAGKGAAGALRAPALAARTGEGATRDVAEGNRWLERAAEQGDPEALMYLGHSYLQGDGYPKDEARGIDLLRKGAEAGSASAQHYLGDAYRK